MRPAAGRVVLAAVLAIFPAPATSEQDEMEGLKALALVRIQQKQKAARISAIRSIARWPCNDRWRKESVCSVDVAPRRSSVRTPWLRYFPRPRAECAPLCSDQAE